MDHKKKRAVNFDLSEDQLKQYYSAQNPKGAYRKIEKFFMSKDFTHRQYSGYVSNKPLSDKELMNIMFALYYTFPWLIQCAEKMDVTDIGQTYDIKDVMDTFYITSPEKISEKQFLKQQMHKKRKKSR